PPHGRVRPPMDDGLLRRRAPGGRHRGALPVAVRRARQEPQPDHKEHHMRVLVTGGAGFIGANLCRTLTTRPEVESLTVLDDLRSGDPANLADVGADLVIGSILDRDLLAELV